MSSAYTGLTDLMELLLSARVSTRLFQALPLALLLLGDPRIAAAQAASTVVARATVVSERAPRLGISLAATPVVTSAVSEARRAEGTSGAAGAAVQVTSTVRVAGNTGFRLFVRAREGVAEIGLSVRDASGTFRPLVGGGTVEVARGTGGGEVREIVFRIADETAATDLPVVYELVYDPVA